MKPMQFAVAAVALIGALWLINTLTRTPEGVGNSYVAAECRLDGCSNTECVNKDAPSIATTCEWRKEYACYRIGRCEVQKNGQCGWTQSLRLKSCLE